MRAIGAAVERQPRPADAGLAAAVVLAGAAVLAARRNVAGTLPTPADWVGIVACAVPLVWRRVAPSLVFWVVVGLVWAVSLVPGEIEAPIIAIFVALYAVGRYRPMSRVWLAVAGVAASLGVSVVRGTAQWSDALPMAAVVAATVLLGRNAHTRQAYLSALRDRAVRLERERDQQARLAVAEERSRIAREMHDIVAHNLAVMVALADGAALVAATAPQRGAEAMLQVSRTGREALDEMRRLVGLLRAGPSHPDAHLAGARSGQAALAPAPGLSDLDRLVEQVRAAGLRVAFTLSGTPGPWGPGPGLAIYRIVQEALTNTLKHAGPRASADVTLRLRPDGAEIEVLDDGAGRAARPPTPADRHGLTGMAERAEAYHGRFEAGPRPGSGWRVWARLSFEPAAGGDALPCPEPAS